MFVVHKKLSGNLSGSKGLFLNSQLLWAPQSEAYPFDTKNEAKCFLEHASLLTKINKDEAETVDVDADFFQENSKTMTLRVKASKHLRDCVNEMQSSLRETGHKLLDFTCDVYTYTGKWGIDDDN